MAGAGYKLFTTGSVLTAADVNTYLAEQTVMVFANAAARTSALSGVVSEGMISYLKDTNAVEVYDGSNWVSSDDPNAIQNTIVDAKGDLITATANDTPARLAVGNNGETLVADSSASTGLRWQAVQSMNMLHNSAFDVWQRGTSIALSNNTSLYTADRWQGYRGTTGATVSRQAADSLGTTPAQYVKYCARVQRDSGNTATDAIYLVQSYENLDCAAYIGKTITLSFYARKGANYSQASSQMSASIVTGTNTTDANQLNFTGFATAATSDYTLTTSWQRFSLTTTLGTSITQFGPRFFYTPAGTAGAADYFEITGVKLEVGSVATNYSRSSATLAGELAACQRYYYKVTPTATYQDILNGSTNDSTAYARYCMKFPVTMRTAPTMGTTGTAGDYGNLVKTGFAGATGVPTSNDSRVDGITIYLTSASIATGDAPCLRNSTGGVNSNNWLTFSSEL